MKRPFTILTLTIACLLILASCASTIGTAPSTTKTSNPTPTGTPQPAIDIQYLAGSDPAEVDNTGLPVTPIDQLHITGNAPEVNIADYRLNVDGLVENPLTLTYDTITAYPSITKVVLLICPLVFVDNAEWTGIPVSTLLAEAVVKSGAAEVTFESFDGYKYSLPIEDVQKDGIFLAYKVDGQVLPPEHGYPLRLVIPGEYGGNWVKWVTHIEVS